MSKLIESLMNERLDSRHDRDEDRAASLMRAILKMEAARLSQRGDAKERGESAIATVASVGPLLSDQKRSPYAKTVREWYRRRAWNIAVELAATGQIDSAQQNIGRFALSEYIAKKILDDKAIPTMARRDISTVQVYIRSGVLRDAVAEGLRRREKQRRDAIHRCR